jgi:glucosamine--fructose-6-phosphate aminotransferase (isomerizing)
MQALAQLPAQIDEALKLEKQIKGICDTLQAQNNILLWGRGSQFATALEGAHSLVSAMDRWLHTEYSVGRCS